MSNILITGGGRGLGLELTRQLRQLPKSRISRVFVTTRGPPSKELQEAIAGSDGRIIHLHCEITDENSVRQAVAELESRLGNEGLDILINNAGVMPVTPEGVKGMDGEQLIKAFDVNVVAAQRITSALIPSLQKSKDKKIIMVSSTAGSMAYTHRYSWAPTPEYKITKAAMNMLAVQYALEFGNEGFTVLAISPGWLKTDMGSEKADLEVKTGVEAVKNLILKADPTMNGKFYNIHVPGWENAEGPNQYDGAELPW
ncbi:putative short chain oxidoreductase [Xylogone sp. PMI_703]|nr:putative short chain oxidoreductase [Xylogone sp. PMI_703]